MSNITKEAEDQFKPAKKNKITRVEVIDHSSESTPFGRVYTKYNCKEVEIQEQDGGRTLKIFIK